MKTSAYILFAIVTVLISCQSKVDRPTPILKNNNNASSVTNLEDKRNTSNLDPLSAETVAAQRAQALAILNHRLKKDPDFYTIMEQGVWELQFVHRGEMKQFQNHWFDFKKDHTYEYGTGSLVEGSGKYNYHFERSELLMIDNLSTKKPEEWTVKNSGDMMVLVGTATYKDNHTQKKLVNQNDSFRG